MMERRELGKSGISIAPLMFGGNVFDWTIDQTTSFGLLDAFVGAGFNAVDTADVYSVWVPGHKGGESETVLGAWLKARGNRAKVVVATKCGAPLADDKKGLSAKWIKQACDDSLKRLQTDYIDLYQAHRDDTETPMEETLTTFADLIKAGKVRAIGCSNFTAPRIKEALATAKKLGVPRYETLQPLYNMTDRKVFEAELGPLCKAENIGVIPYYALAAGFLTGKYRSEADAGKSKRGGGMKKYLNPRGMGILDALDAVARRLDATPAQVAVAWLMTRPGVTAPIASATSGKQLDDLVAATKLKLDAAALEQLEKASAE